MLGKKWWVLALIVCVGVPLLGGCGGQRDQKQLNRGLDRPKQATEKEAEIPNPNKEIPDKAK
jgi:hypothetical protein